MKEKKPRDIRERSFDYALRAIKLYQFLQEGKDGAGWVLSKQYLRSATSVGANIEEAQSGQSKAEMSIAQKEARESLYWLRLLVKSQIVSTNHLESLIQETEELIAVITRIIRKTKQNDSEFR